MKKNYTFLIFCFALVIFQSKAQTTIYNENFDNPGMSLPTGWVSSPSGWIIDSTNFSTGYAGASGLKNVKVDNTLQATGDYALATKSISTIGYSTISVLWAARLTTHFPDSASSVQSFDYSIDGGITWTNLPYTENTNNSTWALDNAGSRINVPANAANVANLMFRIVVHIHNAPSGTYRIDDFNVEGNLGSGITESEFENSINIYMENASLLHIASSVNQHTSDSYMQLSLIDAMGRVCASAKLNPNETEYLLPKLQSGIYFVTIIQDGNSITKKIFIHREE